MNITHAAISIEVRSKNLLNFIYDTLKKIACANWKTWYGVCTLNCHINFNK